jgi:hypothetical protein
VLCVEEIVLLLLLKVSSPYEVAEFDIMFGEGINALGCLFDVARELDVVEARVRRQCRAEAGRRGGDKLRMQGEGACTLRAGTVRSDRCGRHLLSHFPGLHRTFPGLRSAYNLLLSDCLLTRLPGVTSVCLQGAHYYFEGVKLAQGRDNVLRHLKENPDTAARITTAVQARMAEVRGSSGSGKALGGKKAAGSLSAEELEAELGDFDEELLDDDGLAADLGQQMGRLGAADS